MTTISNSKNTIYGVILNDNKTLDTLNSQFTQAPYKQPPALPVLYIKPFESVNHNGTVTLPSQTNTLEIGSTLALVMGKTASRLTVDNALSAVSEVMLAVDLSLPHDSYYRPAIREKCFDGSLVLGQPAQANAVANLDVLMITTEVNGEVVNTRSLKDLKRPIAQLLADVTQFLTLNVGDILLVGVEYQAPQAKAGDTITVKADGLDSITFSVQNATATTQDQTQAQSQPPKELPMPNGKTGRILLDGKVEAVTPAENGKIQTQSGQLLDENDVEWLPPIDFGSVFALGLNYAAHAKELDFKAPETPLVFLKGKNTLIGHNAKTPRPSDAEYMHYECELAVVIGKQAKNVTAEQAKDYILGYTVANDYAIRDYLENYYRPNLCVKNRDDCTPIGPWLTPAKDVKDPMNLPLFTRINGETTQSGNTNDMIFDVYHLIAYLSSIMTLNAGDVILTGTPEGLADAKFGDVVETEIDGLGILRNTIMEKV